MPTPNPVSPPATSDLFLRRQVEAMAGYGIPAEDIAKALGIDLRLVMFDYKAELEAAGIKANAKVAENLFRKATGDGREAVTAAIFWMKTRAGWKEAAVHEIRDTRSIEELSDAELEAIVRGVDGAIVNGLAPERV